MKSSNLSGLGQWNKCESKRYEGTKAQVQVSFLNTSINMKIGH